MKRVLKITGICLLLFVISVLAVNLIVPAFNKSVSDEYKTEIAKTEFISEEVGNEKILCIDDNEEALLWRLRMIGSAKKSIVLVTFDFRTDQSGTAIMAALYDAAERGVEIQILIDGIYQLVFLNNNDTFDAFSMHENIEVRFYNPILLKNIYRVNYRMHDKYLMIDDTMYLLGGRNTNDIFLGEREKGMNEDRDILVYETIPGKGESFQQLRNYFYEIWNESCVEPYAAHVRDKVLEEEKVKLKKKYCELKEKYADIGMYEQWEEVTWEANKITLLTNGTKPQNRQPRVLYAMQQVAAGGKDIIIQTPYAICNKYMYSVLEDMESTAEVKLILNAVEKGSNPWGCTDYLNNKEKILDTGVDVYELMNKHAVHTKTVLIDDRLSMIGSYNLDMRSTYLDTELMLVIDSEELNEHLREMAQEYMERSREVSSDGTVKDGAEYKERELPAKKKTFYAVLRVVIRGVRHLL